ncbi:MAG: N-succinylarginine dihydrolase [Waddliaceae bacterium]|nr:N-succinylarginine dihydrolase [Waddliaceae bacterium]
MKKAREYNFDGLVGPTHNYSGLSLGNLASTGNKAQISRPREAALQGLQKMKALHDLGIPQAVLPPQERPLISVFHQLGFRGTDAEILEEVASKQAELLSLCSSAASMWTANAATVCPSSDSIDGLCHLTPANLHSKFHRSLEPISTYAILQSIFKDTEHFAVHPALPQNPCFGDEGAANHTRFCKEYGTPGLHFFVYGKESFRNTPSSKKFPARQSLEASQAIARLHRLNDSQTFFAQQNPKVIDLGVFHNDVISVGNQNVYFYHEEAFIDSEQIVQELCEKAEKLASLPLCLIKVSSQELSVEDAVSSYLFNSQIVCDSSGNMLLIVPSECVEMEQVRMVLERVVSDKKNPISKYQSFNLRESMKNGGGPACLRLRVVLNEKEEAAMNQAVCFSDSLYTRLETWVQRFYRETLTPSDLADPLLLNESRMALDELSQILDLGSIYEFQNETVKS